MRKDKKEATAKQRKVVSAALKSERFPSELLSQLPVAGWGAPAWSKCPLGSAPARLLCLLRARLAALAVSALRARGWATGRPATASDARASRLQSRRFHHLRPFRHGCFYSLLTRGGGERRGDTLRFARRKVPVLDARNKTTYRREDIYDLFWRVSEAMRSLV